MLTHYLMKYTPQAKMAHSFNLRRAAIWIAMVISVTNTKLQAGGPQLGFINDERIDALLSTWALHEMKVADGSETVALVGLALLLLVFIKWRLDARMVSAKIESEADMLKRLKARTRDPGA